MTAGKTFPHSAPHLHSLAKGGSKFASVRFLLSSPGAAPQLLSHRRLIRNYGSRMEPPRCSQAFVFFQYLVILAWARCSQIPVSCCDIITICFYFSFLLPSQSSVPPPRPPLRDPRLSKIRITVHVQKGLTTSLFANCKGGKWEIYGCV